MGNLSGKGKNNSEVEDFDFKDWKKKNKEKKINDHSTPFDGDLKKLSCVDFSVETLDGIESDPNYGHLPLNIIHNILLFMKPEQLFQVFLTCKMFYKISNSDYFWKDYYGNYFFRKETKELKEQFPNWKSTFVNKYVGSDFVKRNEFFKKMFTFDQKDRSGGIDCLIKGLILGDHKSGKTSLLDRLCEGNFFPNTPITVGIDFRIKSLKVGGKMARMRIWDTAGQHIFREITKSYYRGAHLFIICFNLNDKSSFDEIEVFVKNILDYGQESCVNNVVVVGCKKDLERKVTRYEVEQKMKEIGFCDTFDHYCECSAKDGSCVYLPFGLAVKLHYLSYFTCTMEPEHQEVRIAKK